MTYTSAFVQTTIEGKFGTGAGYELWRTGFKMPVTGTAPAGATVGLFLAAISDPVSTYHQNGSVMAGVQTYLTSIAGAVVGTDGKYLGGGQQVTQRYTYPSPVAGLGTAYMPTGTACCITFQTEYARGRASKGRMYWPQMSGSVEPGTGLISVSDQTNKIAAAKTLIDAINTAAEAAFGDAVGRVSVMSHLGSGTTGTVLKISIGRKLDHQERRERQLSEGHVYTALATTALEAERRQELLDRQIAQEASHLT